MDTGRGRGSQGRAWGRGGGGEGGAPPRAGSAPADRGNAPDFGGAPARGRGGPGRGSHPGGHGGPSGRGGGPAAGGAPPRGAGGGRGGGPPPPPAGPRAVGPDDRVRRLQDALGRAAPASPQRGRLLADWAAAVEGAAVEGHAEALLEVLVPPAGGGALPLLVEAAAAAAGAAPGAAAAAAAAARLLPLLRALTAGAVADSIYQSKVNALYAALREALDLGRLAALVPHIEAAGVHGLNLIEPLAQLLFRLLTKFQGAAAAGGPASADARALWAEVLRLEAARAQAAARSGGGGGGGGGGGDAARVQRLGEKLAGVAGCGGARRRARARARARAECPCGVPWGTDRAVPGSALTATPPLRLLGDSEALRGAARARDAAAARRGGGAGGGGARLPLLNPLLLPGGLRPGGPRHDNDHEDFQGIRVLPTAQEVLCEDAPYLPHNRRAPGRAPRSAPAGARGRRRSPPRARRWRLTSPRAQARRRGARGRGGPAARAQGAALSPAAPRHGRAARARGRAAAQRGRRRGAAAGACSTPARLPPCAPAPPPHKRTHAPQHTHTHTQHTHAPPPGGLRAPPPWRLPGGGARRVPGRDHRGRDLPPAPRHLLPGARASRPTPRVRLAGVLGGAWGWGAACGCAPVVSHAPPPARRQVSFDQPPHLKGRDHAHVHHYWDTTKRLQARAFVCARAHLQQS